MFNGSTRSALVNSGDGRWFEAVRRKFWAGWSQVPVPVDGLPPAVVVAAGHYHSACISRDDGALYMWGSNQHGQLGGGLSALGSRSSQPYCVAALKGMRVRDVALGAQHTIALTEDGRVFAWGSSRNGRLGHGKASLFERWSLRAPMEMYPRQVEALRDQKVVAIAAGYQHSACVDDYGRIFAFGYGRFWQLGLGHERDVSEPQRLPGGVPAVEQVACGGNHSAAVSLSGDVLVWGANESSCLGLGRGNQNYVREPVPVPGALARLSVMQVSCGWKHTAAVTANGELFTWGWGGSQGSYSVEGNSSGGQLGLGNEFDFLEPTKVNVQGTVANAFFDKAGAPRQARVLHVSCGFNHTAAVLGPLLEGT
eukprot:TRINITY_DN1406_c0_g1_i2.p1 TRINITY_DN1406_c0_g1~~TRINITY_DN1406_c0_g1_i2.p1  ORF type:complete len:367 (-),score=39.34 TRINITY_DN1406_c0_g1_i2:321-1421(-)